MQEFVALDQRLRRLALDYEAQEAAYPTLISCDVLRRAEYDRAFPHLLMTATPTSDPHLSADQLYLRENLATPRFFLSPAVCYHTYLHFAGQMIGSGTIVTARGTCFRNEDRELLVGRRQIEFQMREIVLLGEKSWLEEQLARLQVAVEEVASEFHISGKWQTAADPFFLPSASGKAALQRIRGTKLEYCVGEDDPLAIASINRHGTFFGERFQISRMDGLPIETACIAFGLDRWAAMRPELQAKPNPVAPIHPAPPCACQAEEVAAPNL